MCVFESYDVVTFIKDVVTSVVYTTEYQSAKAQTEYNNQLLENEAKSLKKEAAEVRQEGIEEARRKKLNAILNIAEDKTDVAASNLSVNSLTALNLFDDEKLNADIEAQNVLNSAEKKSNAYLEKSNEYYRKAQLSSYNFKNRYKQKYFNSLGSSFKSFTDSLIEV